SHICSKRHNNTNQDKHGHAHKYSKRSFQLFLIQHRIGKQH
ncbi:MAG: hypothetical protein ACI84R_002394, partial [Candidatus Azotimanducaceae bacterium]